MAKIVVRSVAISLAGLFEGGNRDCSRYKGRFTSYTRSSRPTGRSQKM